MGDSTATQPPIAVLGAGSWGTALAILLAQSGQAVTLWARNESHLASMLAARRNERFLPGIAFPDALSLAKSTDLSALSHIEHFLLVVPSHAFRQTVENLKKARQQSKDEKISLIWGSKGFDPKSSKLLSEVVKEVFADEAVRAIISGPSFAKETAIGLPTALVMGCEDAQAGERFATWFRSPTTRVYPNTDLNGVQIGGAVKNVMAIAAGISDGIGYGANARAALITRGLAELTRFGVMLGGSTETFMGLAGMGDLILTCTDNQSRNRRLGLGIGKGQDIHSVIAEIGQEVEGYNTAKELYKMAQNLSVSMPITEQVYSVLHEARDPKIAVQQLLQRQPKAENT